MTGPQHMHNRLVMTAPRPRLQRLLSDAETSSSTNDSFDNENAEELLRKSLFAPPVVAQNEIFRSEQMTANNHHLPQRQMIHSKAQPPTTANNTNVFRNSINTSHSINGPTIHRRTQSNVVIKSNCNSSILIRTPPKNNTNNRHAHQRKYQTASKVTRTGSEQYCGLSAEITREISYRTPSKARMQTPGGTKSNKHTPNRRRGILKTPVSRDLFRSKSSGVSSSQQSSSSVKVHPPVKNSMTDSKLMQIQLTPTMDTASSSSDDGSSSSSSDFPYNMNVSTTSSKATHSRSLSGSSASSIGVTFMPSKASQMLKRKEQPTTNPSTPKQVTKKQKIRKTPFVGKLSARKKLKKCLTPPRNTNFGSHIKSASSRAASTLLSLSTSFDGVDNYRLTSSEHDPSPFQIEIVNKKEIVAHSKICSMMDGYTGIQNDFNFGMLCGVNRSTLDKEYASSTVDKPMILGGNHRDVVHKLLEVTNDVIVEGFFREYTQETAEKESERIEVVILSSEQLRQIIVCFRGSTANQAKPLMKHTFLFGKQQGSAILHDEQKVSVNDTFRSAYFGTPIEYALFSLLQNLGTRKPFFDIVMTGHSFGAALATIASFRYATSKPQMRVSCNVFGSPRVGGEEWRQLVHSVPNLRIYRAENGADPYVMLPNGNEWAQCGHAIQITDLTGQQIGVDIKAHRFDGGSQAGATNGNLFGYVQALPKNLTQVGVGTSQQSKVDHEIQSYVEKLTRSGLQWFDNFCEMGSGISGSDDEIRVLS